MNFDGNGVIDWDASKHNTLIAAPFDDEGTLEFEMDGYRDKCFVFQSGETKADKAVVGSMGVFEVDDATLATLTNDIIILGHGDYLDRIANGDDEELSANDMAKWLQDNGLPLAYGGRIWMWSCHGGVPGGFAQAVFMRLYNLGYHNISVSGPRYITGPIPSVIPGVQSVPTGHTDVGATFTTDYALMSGPSGGPKTPWVPGTAAAYANMRVGQRHDFLHYGRELQ